MDKILQAFRNRVRESYHNAITMTTFIGAGILSYIILYTMRYLGGPCKLPRKPKTKIPEAGDAAQVGEANAGNQVLETSSGPFIVTPSGEIIGSTTEFGGPLQTFVSGESLPAQTAGQQDKSQLMSSFQSQPVIVSPGTAMTNNVVMPGVYQPEQLQDALMNKQLHQTNQRQQQQRLNNFAAALQTFFHHQIQQQLSPQQQPVGGNTVTIQRDQMLNQNNHEALVMPQTTPAENLGHPDQPHRHRQQQQAEQPASPPGSPERKKKKVRKDAIYK